MKKCFPKKIQTRCFDEADHLLWRLHHAARISKRLLAVSAGNAVQFFFSFFVLKKEQKKAAHFETKADIVNRGFSGYTTELALEVAFNFAFGNVAADPLCVVVFFGANDSALPISNQHVPVEAYRKNLSTIVERLRAKWPDVAILIVSPPPINEAAWFEVFFFFFALLFVTVKKG
jgi:hypothetical protein